MQGTYANGSVGRNATSGLPLTGSRLGLRNVQGIRLWMWGLGCASFEHACQPRRKNSWWECLFINNQRILAQYISRWTQFLERLWVGKHSGTPGRARQLGGGILAWKTSNTVSANKPDPKLGLCALEHVISMPQLFSQKPTRSKGPRVSPRPCFFFWGASSLKRDFEGHAPVEIGWW